MTEPTAAPRGPRWRTALSVVLIVLATVLSPVALVGAWAKVELTSTDAFVKTFAPLASDPAIQAVVADRVNTAIDERLDIDGLTQDAFSAIADLDVPPRAKVALGTLAAPAAAGIKSMIDDYVHQFVRSDAFHGVWEQALRTTHEQVVGAQDGDVAGGAVTVGDNGQISIQLAPVIAQVKQVLVARGVPLASNIPEIDRTIVVATTSAAPKVRMAYSAAVELGTWLPFVVLALFAGAIWAANRHRRALVVSGICLAVAMLLTGAALRAGRIVAAAELSPRYLTSAAVRAMWDQVTLMLRSAALATGVLAVAVAVVAWICAPTGAPVRVRGTVSDVTGTVRAAGERHGLTTGSFGTWLYAQRRVLLWALAVVSGAVLLLNRPLTVPLVVWLVVVDVVLVVLLLLLERPSDAPAVDESPVVGTPA